MKIVVVFPTQTEAQYFTRADCLVDFCGVGLTSSAYHTAKIIARHQPDWLIMAGIAGVYPSSSFTVGDTVLVATETEADLGFFTPKGFVHLADHDIAMNFEVNKTLDCPYLPPNDLLPIARSNSLNAAMAPFVAEADIENMEGAAFFQVCLAEQQRFLELRTISNRVSIEDDGDWDFEGSVRQLTAGLHRLIDYLIAQ